MKLCMGMYKLRWNDPIADNSQNLLDNLKECFDDSEAIVNAIGGLELANFVFNRCSVWQVFISIRALIVFQKKNFLRITSSALYTNELNKW